MTQGAKNIRGKFDHFGKVNFVDWAEVDFFGHSRPIGREKVTIHRIEYGPNAEDTKVILSDGKELDLLVQVSPSPAHATSLCAVTLTAQMKGPDA